MGDIHSKKAVRKQKNILRKLNNNHEISDTGNLFGNKQVQDDKKTYSADDLEYFRQKSKKLSLKHDDFYDKQEERKKRSETVKRARRKDTAGPKNKKKKMTHRQKLLRGLLIAICVVTLMALIVVIGGWMVIKHYYSITNYVSDDEVTVYSPSQLDELESSSSDEIYVKTDETDEFGNVIGSTYVSVKKDELSQDEWESIQESITNQLEDLQQQQEELTTIPTASSDHVYNLLFIGVDIRAGQNWNGNSDAMILISINSNTHKIYMTSFMRDLYANIPGVGVDKLNRAHAVGGGPLLVQTIEENFRIHIDNYASVNFYSLINIIDTIGGIDLEVSNEEASVANQYIREMCSGEGISPDAYYLSSGGTLHLNGMQAVAYARIRYVGNADFGRTERQRKVLMQMFAKLQNNPTQVVSFLNAVLPMVTHNIPQETVTSLILNASTYLNYQVETARVPYDGLYSYAGELLVPDFNLTIQKLQETIFQ